MLSVPCPRPRLLQDLSRLGRDLKRTVIIDNAPPSYAFQPENAVPIETWIDDPDDTALLDLIPFLKRLAAADDIFPLLRSLYR